MNSCALNITHEENWQCHSVQRFSKSTFCLFFQFCVRLKALQKASQALRKAGNMLSWPKATWCVCSRRREDGEIGQLVCCVGAPWACTCVTFPKNQALTAPEKLGSWECTYATWIQGSYYLQAGTSCRAIALAVVRPGSGWGQWLHRGCCMAPSLCGMKLPVVAGGTLGRKTVGHSWGLLKLFFFFLHLNQTSKYCL